MSNQAPEDPRGREGDDHAPKPPWETDSSQDGDAEATESLESVFGITPDDGSPASTDSLSSFDDLFEKRIREAVQEVEAEQASDPSAPAEAPAPADDNPLGVYADLAQTESPPGRAREAAPSAADTPADDERSATDTDTPGVDTPAPAAEPAPPDRRRKRRPEPDRPSKTPAPVEPGPEPVTLLSASKGSTSRFDLPASRDTSAPRPEAPSHLAEADQLSPSETAQADQLAGQITSAGPLLAVRFGLMRNIGLFQHRFEHIPAPGTKVAIRTDRGVELGRVVRGVCSEGCGDGCGCNCVPPRRVAEFTVANGPDYLLKREGKVLRVANTQDLSDARERDKLCRQAKRFCKGHVERMGLSMRLVTVEHLLGGERMTFYFTAEGRIDFRELVKELSSEFKTRVELRQVGARDEARLVGDFERCGRQCCCQSFLKDLKPISMRMAKVQKATLDPSKISGRCGRLMCCLRYEDGGYQELRKTLPKRNTWVRTETLVGRVNKTHVITQLVEIELPDSSRAVVGVEEVLERSAKPLAAPIPKPAPQPMRPPRHEREKRLLRDAPTGEAAAEAPTDTSAGAASVVGAQQKKRRRRRRRGRRRRKSGSSGESGPPAS